MFRLLATAALVATAAVLTAADPAKPTAAQLVGTWKLVKGESMPAGMKAEVTYKKDGTATAKLEFMGKSLDLDATWKLDGDKLVVVSKQGGAEKTSTDTVKKLTADALVTVDEKGQTDEFARVKAGKK